MGTINHTRTVNLGGYNNHPGELCRPEEENLPEDVRLSVDKLMGDSLDRYTKRGFLKDEYLIKLAMLIDYVFGTNDGNITVSETQPDVTGYEEDIQYVITIKPSFHS